MGHPRPRLSVFSRQLLVSRVQARLARGTRCRAAGHQPGDRVQVGTAVSGRGGDGLLDRSSRPHRSPHRTTDTREAEILAARATWRYGPDRPGPLLGLPPSTVHRVLARRGSSRLRDADRVTAAPVRYVACHPGALLHQDHKKLGRLPDGGGWRVLGRLDAPHHGHSNAGYEHLEVVIDDASRYTVVVPVPDETASSAVLGLDTAAAEFASLGIRIERVLTDNGAGYRHTPIATPSPNWVPATSAPDPGARRPTARPSVSSRPCSASGLRTRVSLEPRAGPSAPDVRGLLQSTPTPHGARRAITPRRCQQRPWGSHLDLRPGDGRPLARPVPRVGALRASKAYCSHACVRHRLGARRTSLVVASRRPLVRRPVLTGRSVDAPGTWQRTSRSVQAWSRASSRCRSDRGWRTNSGCRG